MADTFDSGDSAQLHSMASPNSVPFDNFVDPGSLSFELPEDVSLPVIYAW
jgi:hypothetical protein